MKKILSLCTAMLCAFAVSADPVALPATLDVNNVSFRSEGMPDFVIADGQDYAGTYFDMGAHDNPTDTLLYAEWDVTIEPMLYNIAVDVYNTNSWRVQLYLLNQAGDTLKSLRYKGSSGQCGQFSVGAMDMRDLAAGNYKVRAHAATAWSAMKLKDVIFEADYSGVTVELPGELAPAYAELSANASIANGAIAFKPATANDEYATWNVHFAEAGDYTVTVNIDGTNCHDYTVALLSADGETELGAVIEGGCHEDAGVKELGSIGVPAAGDYVVKLTNATQWSNAVMYGITFTTIVPVEDVYSIAGSFNEWNSGANVMTKVADGLYMAQLTLGDRHEFKVVRNGSDWIGYAADKVNAALTEEVFEDAGGNFCVTFPGAPATYVVDFYWNAAEEKVYVKYDLEGNTFTLVGEEAIAGISWDPTAAMNDMVSNGDGTLSLVKSNVALGAGNYGYKVACNHDWSVNFGDPNSGDPNNNAFLTISESGTYDITFSISADKVLSAVAVEQVPFTIADGYYLIGKIEGVEGWSVTDLTADRKFKPNLGGEDGEYFLVADLAIDDQFKVVSVVENAIATWFPDPGSNYVVEADHAGAAKHIYFKPAGEDHPELNNGWHYGKIYVAPNPMELTLVEGWNTICLPYAAEIADVDAYAIEGIDLVNGSISLIEINDVLAPATAYLINGAAGSHEATLKGGKVADPVEINSFRGNLSATPEILNAEDANYGYFVLSGDEFHHLAGDATATVNQYKAYIRMAKNDIPTNAPALRIIENATNLTNIEGETAVKFIENGQLRIMMNGVVYDITGAIVK